MDEITAAAAVRDFDVRELGMSEVANGFTQLAGLRGGEEPDYNARGLGTAYLLYYCAKRAANAAVAFANLQQTEEPVRVLDIGAGTNATSLALSLVHPTTAFAVTAVEPSREMIIAGSQILAELPNITVKSQESTLEQLLDQDVLPGERFDLVTMSAMLPYGWRKSSLAQRVEFGERLLARMESGGRVVVIEPGAKHRELASFQGCLDRTHAKGARILEIALPYPQSREMLLPRTTAVLQRWFPSLQPSEKLSNDAREIVESAVDLGLSVSTGRPDIALFATVEYGPEKMPKMPDRPTPVYRRVGQEGERSRKRKRRIGNVLAMVAIAVAAIIAVIIRFG